MKLPAGVDRNEFSRNSFYRVFSFFAFTFSSFFSLSLSLYLYIPLSLSLNPQRVLLRKSTIIGLLLIFENTYFYCSELVRAYIEKNRRGDGILIFPDRGLAFHENCRKSWFRTTKVERDKNAFSRILVRTECRDLIFQREGTFVPCPSYRGYSD